MVDKLTKINLVGGLLFLIASGVGIFDTMKCVSEYGWSYEETVIINGVSSTDFVNNYAKLFSAFLVLSFGIIFIMNGNALSSSFSTTPLGDIQGIIFPNGEPEYWFLEHNPSDDTIHVGLDEYSIDFPLSLMKKEESS